MLDLVVVGQPVAYQLSWKMIELANYKTRGSYRTELGCCSMLRIEADCGGYYLQNFNKLVI